MELLTLFAGILAVATALIQPDESGVLIATMGGIIIGDFFVNRYAYAPLLKLHDKFVRDTQQAWKAWDDMFVELLNETKRTKANQAAQPNGPKEDEANAGKGPTHLQREKGVH